VSTSARHDKKGKRSGRRKFIYINLSLYFFSFFTAPPHTVPVRPSVRVCVRVRGREKKDKNPPASITCQAARYEPVRDPRRPAAGSGHYRRMIVAERNHPPSDGHIPWRLMMKHRNEQDATIVRHQPDAGAGAAIAPELLRSAEAARMLSIGTRTLWRWSRSGKMPRPIKIADGTVRFRTAELREWIEAGCPRVD
jgi:prophage regulatory protein